MGPGAWTLIFQFGALSAVIKRVPVIGTLLAVSVNYAASFIIGVAERLTPNQMRAVNASVYMVVARPI